MPTNSKNVNDTGASGKCDVGTCGRMGSKTKRMKLNTRGGSGAGSLGGAQQLTGGGGG